MRPKKGKSLQVICPHCQSMLKVDPVSGDILASQKPVIREVESFDDALDIEKKHEERKSGLFEEAILLERKRKELLEKKFRESKETTEDDGSPPPRPFDYS